MDCKVIMKINKVSCPGQMHLPSRHPVFVSICMFGQLYRTENVYPSFPLVFNMKLVFKRHFTNARTVDQVMEILEDEKIILELRQSHLGEQRGVCLAVCTTSVRSFLFPCQSMIPKEDHTKRELFLPKTENFPCKGLDPQLEFKTRTCLQEADDVLSSSVRSYEQASGAAASSPHRHRSFVELSSSSADRDLALTSSAHARHASKKTNTDHCICECPRLHEESFDHESWLNKTLSFSLDGSRLAHERPFRVGKAPATLISDRSLNNTPSSSLPAKAKLDTKGLCSLCLVPSPNCALCNAYQTIYGQNFLKYRMGRLQRSRDIARISSAQTAAVGDLVAQSYARRSVSPSHIPPRARARPPEDDSSEEERALLRTAPPVGGRKVRSRIFDKLPANGDLRGSRSPDASEIRRRIRDLMKKNNSVLQYELTSDESLSDDSGNAKPRRKSTARPQPAYMASSLDEARHVSSRRSRRAKFERSMNAIYKDLYEKTAQLGLEKR